MSHDNWRTPPALFAALSSEFKFDLDAAATPENTLCERFITADEDALVTPWDAYNDVFVNPPYTLIGPFVKRAYEQSQEQHNTVVVLIPTYTDPKYWKDYVCKAHEVRNLVGRLQFLDENGLKKQSARFPSSVIVFKWIQGTHYGYAPHIWSWQWREGK